MEELKLHSKGFEAHLRAIEDTFNAIKINIKNNTNLTSSEKEAELSKAKELFLEQKKQGLNKLF